MKRITHSLCLAVFALFVFSGLLLAGPMDDVNSHKQCDKCGMSRESFAFSRMLIQYEDGSEVPVCSLHCAAMELAIALDKIPKSIKVGDFGTRQLIEADKAFWVVGGNKPGVMSKRAKWAFATKEDAESFIGANQGKLVSYDEAMKAAYEDMPEDTKMIRQKRQMMQMKESEHKHNADQ
jgi:copper chaperone NosL